MIAPSSHPCLRGLLRILKVLATLGNSNCADDTFSLLQMSSPGQLQPPSAGSLDVNPGSPSATPVHESLPSAEQTVQVAEVCLILMLLVPGHVSSGHKCPYTGTNLAIKADYGEIYLV